MPFVSVRVGFGLPDELVGEADEFKRVAGIGQDDAVGFDVGPIVIVNGFPEVSLLEMLPVTVVVCVRL